MLEELVNVLKKHESGLDLSNEELEMLVGASDSDLLYARSINVRRELREVSDTRLATYEKNDNVIHQMKRMGFSSVDAMLGKEIDKQR